jgi:hypothetical protein
MIMALPAPEATLWLPRTGIKSQKKGMWVSNLLTQALGPMEETSQRRKRSEQDGPDMLFNKGIQGNYPLINDSLVSQMISSIPEGVELCKWAIGL